MLEHRIKVNDIKTFLWNIFQIFLEISMNQIDSPNGIRQRRVFILIRFYAGPSYFIKRSAFLQGCDASPVP